MALIRFIRRNTGQYIKVVLLVTCSVVILTTLLTTHELDTLEIISDIRLVPYHDRSVGPKNSISEDSQVLPAHESLSRESFILETELRYRDKLMTLTERELDTLSSIYHRDVRIHWGSDHGLLPPGKPLPDPSCERHLHTASTQTVSVVMCMRNELTYLLLRTLTTIKTRTPTSLLHEIVLIDDGSTTETLSEVKQYAVQLSIPLITYRNSVSVGITSCRRQGIEQAEGSVIVILDSHMEVSELWLEPLLDILQSKPNSIAVPTLHLINEQEYSEKRLLNVESYGVEAAGGYFTFRYYNTGPESGDQSAPYRSASIFGGGLAALKPTLLRVYPTTVYKELWGTENVRLAVRSWLCGGGVWMTRCSQILHTTGSDGELKRYKSYSGQMDKHLRYETLGDIINFIPGKEDRTRFLQSVFSSDDEISTVKNVSGTIKSRFDASQCTKDYFWYLQNVHPTPHFLQFQDNNQYHLVGEIQSLAKTSLCIQRQEDSIIANNFCSYEKGRFLNPHLFGFTRRDEVHVIWHYKACLDAGSASGDLITYTCHTDLWPDQEPGNSQKFRYNETSRRLEHFTSYRCVELTGEKRVVLRPCNDCVEQKWLVHKARWA